MEHNIMGDMVRPRRTSGWTTYNKQNFRISGTVDSLHYKFGRKVIPEKKHESVTQNYSTGMKQKGNIIGQNTISLTKTFTEYCDKCSLHGLKYVGDLQLHPLERMFWAISFLLAVATAAYFITLLYHKWEENPVIISVGATATQLTSIPFPALTICNMNRARKSVANKIVDPESPDHELNRILLNDLCDDTYVIYNNKNNITPDMQKRIGKWDTIQTFMKNTLHYKNIKLPTMPKSKITHYAGLGTKVNIVNVFNYESPTPEKEEDEHMEEYYGKVGQSCEQMIKSCSYAGSIENCQDIFNPTLTDEGICCSFNKVKRDYIFRNPRDLSDLNITFPKPVTDWTPEAGYPPGYTTETLPWKPRGAGSHLGLTLVLDANLDDYYCSSTESTGFKMRLHNPVETPKIAEFGFLISAGQEYRLAIKPTISNASSSIRRIPPKKRQCVFSNEKFLKYYRTYTQRNCAMECEANYTLAMCKCVPYYLPKDANTTICAKKDENCTRNARNAIEMRLVDESVNTSNFERDSQDLPPKQCQCLPGCTELRYRATISSGRMYGTRSLTKEYAEFMDRTYFRKNMAVVHIFFTESQFMNYYKSELFGFTEFLSSTGGLLGLFLGFSFLSAVEAIYFMSMRLWCSIIQRNQHAANQQASLPLTNSSHISIVTPYPFAQ